MNSETPPDKVQLRTAAGFPSWKDRVEGYDEEEWEQKEQKKQREQKEQQRKEIAKAKLTKGRAAIGCTCAAIVMGGVVDMGFEQGGAWGIFFIVLGTVGIFVWCYDILRRT